MFPIAALGAGLGQFAQDYRQQQESALRQLQARMLLEQMQREQQTRGIAGAALSAGGLPGFGQQLPQIQMSPTQPGPTAPVAPVSRTPLQPYAPAGPRTLTEEDQDALETGPAELTPEQADKLYGAVGASESRAGVPLQPPVPTDASPSPGYTAAPGGGMRPIQPGEPRFPGSATSPVPAGPASASQPSTDSAPAVPPGIHDLASGLNLVQRLDPTAIAKRIKEIRPGASDDQVFSATEMLMKMAQGDRTAQYQAAMIGHLLNYDLGEKRIAAGEQHQAAIDARAAGHTAGGETTVAEKSRQDRAAAQQQTQAYRDQRLAEQKRQFRERMNEATRIKDRGSQQQALNRMLTDIDANLGQLRVQGGHDKEIAELERQRVELQGRLRDLAGMSRP